MKTSLLRPRGFCAGVTRAIEIVRRALELHGAPVHVLHEIVHNAHVVAELAREGAVFVEELDQVPPGAVVVFSAHGVAAATERRARERGLRVIDATCPLVAKVHAQAQRYRAGGRELVIVGHEGHPEVEGTRGRVAGPVHVVATVAQVRALAVRDPRRLAYVTQTTLSVDDVRDVVAALERRFPGIRGPALDDVCYATQNRQQAVRDAAPGLDVLIVVGARNSSNSNRLREVGARCGLAAHLVPEAAELEPAMVAGRARVGVTAGASAPEAQVRAVVRRLRALGAGVVEELPGVEERVLFALPDGLDAAPPAGPRFRRSEPGTARELG